MLKKKKKKKKRRRRKREKGEREREREREREGGRKYRDEMPFHNNVIPCIEGRNIWGMRRKSISSYTDAHPKTEIRERMLLMGNSRIQAPLQREGKRGVGKKIYTHTYIYIYIFPSLLSRISLDTKGYVK